MTYEKLLEEKSNLEKSAIIYKKVTEELLKGNNLKSIVEVVYKETATPGMITNDKHHLLASTGISSSQLKKVHEEFTSYIQLKQTLSKNGKKIPIFNR